ncbi:hypothetical protein [Lachnoclostridium sp. An76]|uniref:hypothetical protein n=1 Tax=Lachnoclostridium sp. An76 TaxID=1965654 RepID=UPI000B58347B|nr:hypothetical protein [Lachnoclostridium sp. An76]OUN33299.1 hypothetical protein B5G27_13065 [Lachnoclostridium sp. An76]
MRKDALLTGMMALAAVSVLLTGCTDVTNEKPVIYLYPEQVQEVYVQLELDGEFTCTYPEYDNGWKVKAYPDGTLRDQDTGKEYNYLFWEGTSGTEYDLSRGFVVEGKDTAGFLEEKLAYLGLNEKERNEFIVYWLPRMEDNKYNLITFQGEDYTEHAKLKISPEPDSILRVFMVYKPLDKAINIPEQELEPFEREGFTVIEWGGAEME